MNFCGGGCGGGRWRGEWEEGTDTTFPEKSEVKFLCGDGNVVSVLGGARIGESARSFGEMFLTE